MKTLYITLLIVLAGWVNVLNGQTIFFEEDFENNGIIPEGWSNIYISGSHDWRYENGGFSTDTTIPNSRKPPAAYQGNYNALFEKTTLTSTITKLVTPEINLELGIKPELHFRYANYTRTVIPDSPENDEIRVYYRSVDEDVYDWILLHEITEPHSEWTEAIVLIPDSVRFTNVELAFEGTVGPGWGACIDDISIIETGVIPKYLESVKLFQTNNYNDIPTGSINNPILKLEFKVKGNDGNLHIDSLIIDALLDAANIIPNKGVKLYFTTKNQYSISTPVGDSVSFINNKAIFKNLDFNLPYGYSYLWITYDIPMDTNHELNNKKVDGKISKNNIVVNGLNYPFVDLNPSGYRTIVESVYFDDFEGAPEWTLTGEFEIDEPQGLGGSFGSSDPDLANNGVKILGTDLTGLGLIDGDYENSLANNEYMATSQVMNCKYYKDLKVQYYQWLNVENSDSAKIQVLNENYLNWKNVWRNSSLVNNDRWSLKQYSIKQYADRQGEVSLRFTLGPTNSTWTFSGWNVDDFAVTGTFVTSDIGISDWVSPGAGCGHVAPDQLTVVVKNYGYAATNDTLPLGFSVDEGNSWVMDTLFTSIEKDETATFTFSSLIDLTTPGENLVWVKTFWGQDQDSRNDMLDTTLYILPTLTLPYAEDFETGTGFWQSGGQNTWEYGIPYGTLLDTAASGQNVWATGLAENYPDNDSSWIESPCFDLTGTEKPMIELKIASDCELGQDGLALYYSIDLGQTWNYVPKVNPYDWNWYTQTINSIGNEGWDSLPSNDGIYTMARQTLPAEVAGANPVKFRLLFESDQTNNYGGFLIDDIRIYEAPLDAGVAQLVSPQTSCYLSENEPIEISVKNFGIRDFKTSDPIITSLILNDVPIVTDTFNVSTPVSPGNEVNFTFSQTLNLKDSGYYYFKSYTHIVSDSNIYSEGVSNDTIMDTIQVQGEPEYTLGPDIGTLQPDTVVLDAGIGYTSYLWNDATTNQTLSLSNEGLYSVTVTNTYNCNAIDTINVIASVTDLAISSVSGINSGCQGAVTPNLNVSFTNYGDTTYHPGDTIQLGYRINDEQKIIETYTIEEDLTNGGSVNYTFLNQPDFNIAGNKEFKCFTVFTPELNYNNDTITQTIDIYPLPDVELGEDTLFTTVSTPIVLDAGSGYDTYNWQDGSSLQTFTVTDKTSQKYFVDVEDVNACGTDSDTVWVVSDDWDIDTLLSPVTACENSSAEIIEARIINNSQNTYAQGFTIPAIINLNGTDIYDTIILQSPIGSGDTLFYTFTTTLNLNSPGAYDLSIILSPELDINEENNSITKNIETFEIQTVDLGNDTIVTLQADTILLDAGADFASYQWNKGGTFQTFQITDLTSEFYKVTVEDPNGCATTSDSVQIMATDVSIDNVITPTSSCSLDNTTKIEFIIKNTGNDAIPAGTEMQAHYKVNNENWIQKPFNLTFTLEPDKTKTISINENIAFESGSSYDFSLAVKFDNDFYNYNDTAYSSIFEFESPNIELGPDIYTLEPDTIVITAQEGLANYQWQDLSSEHFYNVSYPATKLYHCLVNNAYGCTDSDSIMIYTYDVSISAIPNIQNTCETTLSQSPQIEVSINGYDTLLIGDEITASYQLNGNTAVQETITLDDTLTQEQPYLYTFETPLNISDTGDYSLSANITLTNEVETTNNNFTKAFRVGAYPVDLGEDIVTYNSSTILDAGSGFSEYLWNDESTAQTLWVDESGKYKVTITDVNGCTASDSVNVLFLAPQYDIISINGLKDSCLHNNTETVAFTLQNNGNDTIPSDSIVPISYQINEGTAVEEEYTFTNKFIPGDAIEIVFTNKADFSVPGSYSITASIQFGDSTATLDSTIQTWGLPVVDLGNDTTSTAASIVLSPGENFASYVWNTEETTSSITVSEDGQYWVKATTENGCSNADTINVHFIPVSIYVSEFLNPLNDCGQMVDEAVDITLANGGQRTIEEGTTLKLSYQVNSLPMVTENITFASDIATGATFNYSFTHKLSVDAPGNHDIRFFVEVENIGADTADYTLEIFELPEFSFESDTIKVSEYPYGLNPEVTATSYLWSTGETTSNITINNDGEYWLKVTDDNTCTFTDTVFIKQTIGVFDEWGEEINIYPNPARHALTIEIPQIENGTMIDFVDMQGRIIKKINHAQENQTIDITNWQKGVYLIRIYNDKHHALFQSIIK